MVKTNPLSSAALVDTSRPPVSDVDDLLDIEAVCRFFGGTKPLHPATIYRGLGKLYPRPFRVAPNANRWSRVECEAARRAIMEAPREPLISPRHRSPVGKG